MPQIDPRNVEWDEEPIRPENIQWEGAGEESGAWQQTASTIARPVLESIGMVGGGMAGTPLGPVGAVAGGAIGYGVGSQAADLLDIALGVKEKPTISGGMLEGGKQLKRGLEYEMLGGIIPAAIVPMWRGGKIIFQKGALDFTKRGMEKTAGDVLKAATSHGDVFVKNAEEAAAIEAEIPGIKFTRGQATGGPAEIKLERAQFRKPGEAGPMATEQIARNDQAIRDYMARKFPGESGIEEYLTSLRGTQEELGQITQTAKGVLEAEAAGLAGKGPTEIGLDIVSTTREAKEAAKKAASELYEQIPESNLNIETLFSEAQDIAKKTVAETSEDVPDILGRFIQKYGGETPETTVSLADLKAWRTKVLNEVRELQRGATPNLARLSRLNKFENSIENAIEQLGDETKYGTEVVEKFRNASKAWRTYKETYEQGTIGDILRRGPRGESTRMAESQIAGTFWGKKPEAGDALIRAVGKDRAREAVRNYANYDLLKNTTNPVTGEIDRLKLFRWQERYRSTLRKFGLENEYGSLRKAVESLTSARAMQAEFEKSATARMLQADPEKAISAAFSGGEKRTADVARGLLKQVRGNETAVAGLRKAFADHILAEAETTAKTIEGKAVVSPAFFQRQMKKYGPALDVLFAGNPEQFRAIRSVQRAYEVAARNKVSPLGGGSDTVELASQLLSTLATRAVSTYRSMNLVRAGMQIFSTYKDKQVEAFINRAIFDPEYANTLIAISREGVTPRLQQRLSTQMTALGVSLFRQPERSQ